MRIDASMVGMESARSYTSVTQSNTTVTVVTGQTDGKLGTLWGETEEGRGNPSASQEEFPAINRMPLGRSISSLEDKRAMQTIKEQCMQYLIYWLFSGRDSKSIRESLQDWQAQNNNMENMAQGNFQVLETTASYYHHEQETTSFSTKGTVITADGREISFNLELEMSRSFQEYYESSYTVVTNMVDPLVINLDTNIASLTDQKFMFDLDADGVLDSISQLGSSSGYLALDKNGDGVINDGSELFGTTSGDGFADLAQYDWDNNGWIDENDEVFEKLMVWCRDGNGKDQLYYLKDLGIGAICLQKASTDFSLNSLKTNQINGQVRNTGIFLYENGNVGTMQHIDVAN